MVKFFYSYVNQCSASNVGPTLNVFNSVLQCNIVSR